ncbi:hypothetical protein HZI31_06290 [Serratia fonticola]|uniref:hypothetical protein n=1 Tax=Serratia fonticola TaxID=47917 RepID=UPI0015C59863|nr:hypothetical protein [Serratia fonticola]NYA42914.1 hypothetical protein [Serratia fonticola]
MIKSTVTNERLKDIASDVAMQGYASEEEQQAMAKELITVREAQPIGSFHIRDQQVEATTDYVKDGEWPIDNGEIIVYAAPPAPAPAVPECFHRLLKHAYGMTMGHDWNKGTMAGHHRQKLCQAVEDCRAAMLIGGKP